MKTLQLIYEADRERLISRISGMDRQTVIREVQMELDRVLLTFNDQVMDDEVREAASCMIQTARSAAGLLDTEGTTRIYGRTEYRSEGKAFRAEKRTKQSLRFWLFLLAGLLCAVAALITAYPFMRDAGVRKTGFLLLGVVLAGLLLFAAGVNARRKNLHGREELHAETSLDPAKVYHQILAVILTVDKVLEGIRAAKESCRRRERRAESNPLDPEQLELIAQLLEDAYGRREREEQAEETCSQLKYYLHRKQIEVVDYPLAEEAGEEIESKDKAARREWFDLIPAYSPGTIRPALVMEGVVLKKGLASNG